MSKPKNDGGPAFPQFDVIAGERDGHGDIIDAYTTSTGGMSLRDWFAGQALAGLLACPVVKDTPEAYAKTCYERADAMIAERAKP